MQHLAQVRRRAVTWQTVVQHDLTGLQEAPHNRETSTGCRKQLRQVRPPPGFPQSARTEPRQWRSGNPPGRMRRRPPPRPLPPRRVEWRSAAGCALKSTGASARRNYAATYRCVSARRNHPGFDVERALSFLNSANAAGLVRRNDRCRKNAGCVALFRFVRFRNTGNKVIACEIAWAQNGCPEC